MMVASYAFTNTSFPLLEVPPLREGEGDLCLFDIVLE